MPDLDTRDVVVVGAGFAGIYALHKLRQQGFDAQVLEAGSGIGGTWFWNRYPGARCDVESMQYSYSFSEEIQQEWQWSELYSPQAEILRYINFVADKLKLRDGIRLNTRVASARFDAASALWQIVTDTGDTYQARYVIMATGCLSVPLTPDIAGLDGFKGTILKTSDWPVDGVDLTGQRVGVIGTGSSAVQAIPLLAEQASQLTVFQRTPNFTVPARNIPISPEYEAEWKENYAERRALARQSRGNTVGNFGTVPGAQVSRDEIHAELDRRWKHGGYHFLMAYPDIATNADVNEVVADFVRDRIREIVRDPQTAEDLMPRDFPIGAKRLCVDTNYYDTYNRDNVQLCNIRNNPIERVTETGVVLADGTAFDLDVLVLATGFDAMTGAMKRVDIRGRDGQALRDEWADGPRTYMGLMVAGFPNMFMVTGPQSPSVLTNMVTSIEQHVDWITETITHLQARNARQIEAEPTAQEDWVAHTNDLANGTLMVQGNSWYLGANVAGKPRIFMPYVGGAAPYMGKLNQATRDGYRGFAIS